MKTIYIKSIKIMLVFTLFVSTSSCSDDFLEVTPKGVVIAQTMEDYDLLLNSPLTQNNSLGNVLVGRSFETCALEPYFGNSSNFSEGSIIRNNFTWQPEVTTDDESGTPSDFLFKYFNSIYIYNKIINEVLGSTGGTEAEKNSIMADARAQRAMVYFELVNLYGQPYNASSASEDLGVPIVTEADVTQTDFIRATVQEVYDFIIEDLNIAIPLLPEGVEERIRMSKGAAMALLGKVHLYMNNFDAAIPLFDGALNDFQNSTLETRLFDYNVSTLPGEIHAAGLFGPNAFIFAIDDLENAFGLYATHPNIFSGSTLLLSPDVSALYGDSDFRLHHFFSRKPFPPFPFTPDYVVPGIYRKGAFLFTHGIVIPDIYLFRAECKARTNDLNGAIADLEFLRMHRMDPADAGVSSGLSQDDLIKYVIDERTREFASKGELWYDMRRLWNDPLFQDRKPYVHTLYDEDGSVKETFTLDEKRLVLRFSNKIMTENPRMQNNPL